MSVIKQTILSSDLEVPTTSPALNLDFANSQRLDPRITFTRASTGTYTGPDGLMRTAGVNEPRFDYDRITGQCNGLLIENSATNLITYSESLGSWGGVGLTFTDNTTETLAPNNTYTASKISVPLNWSSISYSITYQTPFYHSFSTPYHLSFYIKSGGRNATHFVLLMQKSVFSGGSYDAWVTTAIPINPSTSYTLGFQLGSSFFSSNGTFQRIAYPNGWTKVVWSGFTFQPVSGQGNLQGLGFFHTSYGNQTFDGVNSTMYMWGWQFEQGTVPTSYIRTTGSSVTRSADVATISGSNFSSWYNPTEGTFIADTSNPTYDSNIFSASTGTTNYAIEIMGERNPDSRLVTINNSPNSSLTQFNYTYGSQQKVGLSYSNNNVKIANGGIFVGEDLSVSIPTTVDRLRLGVNAFGANALKSSLSRLTYYPKALPPSQLQYLTQ